mmetsp:Transcript_12009/g.18929  ORF Transcript_12009/g.18929 Transcript_12009/m.18929 type:complete len:234 (+) Transcript_12009:119-820(+)|eukprot:CAMPEP_0117045470 /NCGR_PEP_ID=MMETSP0472-20121206/31457_1 /TAXON_ID=693140 ORGANISM="Tiarina fusus, Strain LIS" /NCGR_SAMPLE_ID=MMETSP0472 /ASSEMBLY_ACC=CAM_ASM_000603 /LENGTH=233 /DNA_ID=CAMNT_0004757485 /DNA_START=103 /DNA_END=804 /DNA_ORIENTATION=+
MDCIDDDRIGSKSKKQALLNKFLSKTFHMIDQCDSSIATWSTDGASFVIKDVDEFAKTILPLYFKHSKFASFVRQLNFYSFRKLRTDRDVRYAAKSVRFAHEYFRQGHPDLLHRIQRITKSQEASSVEIRSIKDDIAKVYQQLDEMSSTLDHRLHTMRNAVQTDYQEQMAKFNLAYQALSNLSMRASTSSPPCTPPPTKADLEAPVSPRSTMSPLETLSGVAMAMLGEAIETK